MWSKILHGGGGGGGGGRISETYQFIFVPEAKSK